METDESREHEVVFLLGVCALLLIELTPELTAEKEDALEQFKGSLPSLVQSATESAIRLPAVLDCAGELLEERRGVKVCVLLCKAQNLGFVFGH
jgi:hypothetical protein